MIAFEPTEDQKLMQESVASFAKTLRARSREFERDRALPDDVRKTAHELGLGLVASPKRSGARASG